MDTAQPIWQSLPRGKGSEMTGSTAGRDQSSCSEVGLLRTELAEGSADGSKVGIKKVGTKAGTAVVAAFHSPSSF